MKTFKLYITGCFLAVFALGCSKQEFTLPPVGEKVPYEDEAKLTLKESLAQSPAKLFYQAWQLSNMDEILKKVNSGKDKFTILAPSDAALENGGYNLQKLQSMDQKDLDSLLMFYTLRDRITAEELAGKADNYIATSLLNNQAIILTKYPTSGGGPYYYRHHLQLRDGKTYVNGKVAGTGKSEDAKDGYIWFLDQMVSRPEKTLLQVVEDDERFSLLLQILRRTDAQYNQIIKDATGYDGTREAFSLRFGWELLGYTSNRVSVTTLFLPTNEAFKAAGFNSLEDLLQFNQRRGLPVYGTDSQGSRRMIGNFATDSLLNYHVNWGKLLNLPQDKYQAKFPLDEPVFYSNVMDNAVLSSYVISGAMHVDAPNDPDGEYYMPLDFSTDASGDVLVRVKGADAPSAKVIDPNIYTLMGPIHAVDHLLVPKGFKLN